MLLALDPGSEKTGVVLMDPDTWVISAHAILPNPELLLMIQGGAYGASHLVIEEVRSYGNIVGRTIFQTVFWSGRFAQAFESMGVGRWSMMQRQLVYRSLLARPTGTDAMVSCAVRDLYAERFAGRLGGGKVPVKGKKASPGPLYGVKADEWQALALALTWAREGVQ